MFSYNKRFNVAALFALAPLVSLTAEAQSKGPPSHHHGKGPPSHHHGKGPPSHHHGHGLGHHSGGPGAGALDSGGGQQESASISAPNPADELNAWTHAYESEKTGKLIDQQIKRAQLETRRLWDDYYRQVRENTPSPEEERQLAKIAAMRRSLDPPVYEIHSAQASNVILEDLLLFLASNGKGPKVLVAQDWLEKINVISAQDRSGNMGVLKNQGRLCWPMALRAAEYQESREALAALVPQAIGQAIHGGLQPDTLRDMEKALGKLNGLLADNIKKLTPPRHIESKRYLSELKEALKLLEKPHAGNYFTGKFSARGQTVAELIQHMSQQGLRFAPAVNGDEAAYENLHRALVVYDVAAHQSRQD